MSPRTSSSHPRALALGAVAFLAVSILSSCTTFDSAVADHAYFDFTEASRVCAQVFSCPGLASSIRQSTGIAIDGESFSACMSWLAGPSPAPPGGFAAQAELLRRVADAATCEEAFSELEVRALSPDDPRCAGGAVDSCSPQGEVVDCHQHRIARCPGTRFVAGSTCSVEKDRAFCASGAVGSCNPADAVSECGGAELFVCEPFTSTPQKLDCAAAGVNCILTPEIIGKTGMRHLSICSVKDNTTPTSSCTADGAAACVPDGSSLLLCNQVTGFQGFDTIGGIQVVYGCKKELGWRCGEGGEIAICERPDPDCALSDADVDRCSGDEIDLCIAGRRARVDCRAAGASCVEDPSGGRCVITR